MQDELSVFDIFKIGVGPSSSHTLGPWKAAMEFVSLLEKQERLNAIEGIKIHLYGSLAKTGLGHGTNIAVILGLMGEEPTLFDTGLINNVIDRVVKEGKLHLNGNTRITFSFRHDIEFHYNESLPFHPNALTFRAIFADRSSLCETYYSIGGGFVIQEEFRSSQKAPAFPYPFYKASDLLEHCSKNNLQVSSVVLQNELSIRPFPEIRKDLLQIFDTMCSIVFKGCHTDGKLPGPLNVIRRAAGLNHSLLGGKLFPDLDSWFSAIGKGKEDFRYIMDWISCWALAVNEENAAFGRVVTAPTNGSAGVIPSVLLYNMVFNRKSEDEDVVNFLLTASAIGAIFKNGATISAAMGGCQAEIGVSSAMAAAALTESAGGSPAQVLMAAEIAMEHHLGLTCDPIGGLVQVPCIERNAMGAIKAISASQLAINSDPLKAKVSLDGVVRTMWETALDMNSKYKETSDGGLAANIPISLAEC